MENSLRTAYFFLITIITILTLACSPSSSSERSSIGSEPGFSETGQEGSAASARSLVTALGRLEPKDAVIQVAAPMGDRIQRITVREGDWKQAGQTLALLESHVTRQAEENLISQRLEEAKVRHAAEITHGEAFVREAEVRLRQATELLPLDLQAQDALISGLEAELKTAQQDLGRIENLAARKSAAQQELDHQISLTEGIQARLETAEAQRSRLARQVEVERALARTQLATARKALEKIKVSGEVASLEQQLSLARKVLGLSVLRAPEDGQILRILARPGETTGGQPVLLMGDTRQMYAVAEVYETDVSRIKEGQKARVTSPVLPTALTGSVASIASLVSRNEILDINPAADADRRVVRVKVRLDDSQQAAALVHLQVTVSIQTN